MDLSGMLGGMGGSSPANKEFGSSSASSPLTQNLSGSDTSPAGIDQSFILIGILGLGLLALIIFALKK